MPDPNAGAPATEQKPEPAPEPSLLTKLVRQGLKHGTIVDYITHDGQRRAAIVAYVHPQEQYAELGLVNLTVLDIDGHTYAAVDVRYVDSKQVSGRFGNGNWWEWQRKTPPAKPA